MLSFLNDGDGEECRCNRPPAKLCTFADAARKRLRSPNGGYRRDHLRALAQRVEVAEG